MCRFFYVVKFSRFIANPVYVNYLFITLYFALLESNIGNLCMCSPQIKCIYVYMKLFL